jgi:hypothetical protein
MDLNSIKIKNTLSKSSKNKTPIEPRNSKWNENNFFEDVLRLDIPGSELDDDMEQTGSFRKLPG